MIKNERILQIEYRGERMANSKISKVYQLLVPLLPPNNNNMCFFEKSVKFTNNNNNKEGGKLNEDSSNLCPSLL